MQVSKLSLVVLSLIAGIPALCQPTEAGTPSTTTTIKVFSRETIVDVIVTDAKGKAIRGLKQSDFTIEEDGKPQPIRGFGEFDRSFDYDPGAGSNSEVHSSANAAPSNGPVNIMLVDGLHMNFFASNRALEAISTYASRMPPGTQLAIFWLGASGLHMLQGFTADPSAVEQAVSVQRTDIGSHLDCYQSDLLTINALNQIATYFAPIKGRKNLMWLSSGVPVYLLRDGGYGWGTSTACSDAALEPRAFGRARGGRSVFTGPDGVESQGLDMSQVHRLMDTYEVFTTEQIAVSPINPGGLNAGAQGLGAPLLVAEAVAEQSGGIASYNNNDVASRIEHTIELGSHYYTVSYIPPRRKEDGHWHTLTVRVGQPGLKLIYRRGYNSEDPRQPREYSGPDLIKAALQGRAPAANQIIFEARLVPAVPPAPSAAPALKQHQAPDNSESEAVDVFAAPAAPAAGATAPTPAPAGGSKAKVKNVPPVRKPYDLLISVPQNQIAYGSGPSDSRNIKLQFAFDAYDLNGKLLGEHAQNVAFTLTPEHYAQFVKAPVVFHEAISFFPGALFLRIGVLDNTSNKVGTLEIPVTIPGR